jgi:hypothetical protein
MQLQSIQQKIFEIRGQKVMIDGQEVEIQSNSSSQFVMMKNLPKNRTGKYLPYAFTEHGVTRSNNACKHFKKSDCKKNAARLKPFGREYRNCPCIYCTKKICSTKKRKKKLNRKPGKTETESDLKISNKNSKKKLI